MSLLGFAGSTLTGTRASGPTRLRNQNGTTSRCVVLVGANPEPVTSRSNPYIGWLFTIVPVWWTARTIASPGTPWW
jgi:hypothetical protein